MADSWASRRTGVFHSAAAGLGGVRVLTSGGRKEQGEECAPQTHECSARRGQNATTGSLANAWDIVSALRFRIWRALRKSGSDGRCKPVQGRGLARADSAQCLFSPPAPRRPRRPATPRTPPMLLRASPCWEADAPHAHARPTRMRLCNSCATARSSATCEKKAGWEEGAHPPPNPPSTPALLTVQPSPRSPLPRNCPPDDARP